MKKLVISLQNEGQAQTEAIKAIQHLYSWISERHPKLNHVAATILIKACLQDIQMEHKFQTV